MEKHKENFDIMKAKFDLPGPDIITRLSNEAGFIPENDERPQRCRALIFNPDGTKVLGIARNRPGREPYVVYPGGGLEDSDETAIDGVWRELDEELGLTHEDVSFVGTVIRLENEFFYLGFASAEFDSLQIGGPEAERDVETSGTYEPGWFPVDQLTELNAFPEEITQLVVGAGAI